uniref:Uncharacterized protein n=1 Tax=Anguilla anguilla TaxID=7936 RepID=A0A0E9RBB2_ANGAN
MQHQSLSCQKRCFMRGQCRVLPIRPILEGEDCSWPTARAGETGGLFWKIKMTATMKMGRRFVIFS